MNDKTHTTIAVIILLVALVVFLSAMVIIWVDNYTYEDCLSEHCHYSLDSTYNLTPNQTYHIILVTKELYWICNETEYQICIPYS